MIKSNLTIDNYYIPDNISIHSERAKIYFSRRKYLKNLIKVIHSKLSVNSRAYFLSLFLMDIIFLSEYLEKQFFEHFPMKALFITTKDIQINNYVLLSLVCLMISYKFNGNKSLFYSTNNLPKIINFITEGNYGFTERDLIVGEACVIKILKYKLNFYTVYDYLVFFFTHGIVFQNYLKNKTGLGYVSDKIILEKIYIESRELIDYITDNEEYFELYNGKYNYIIVCQILQWATEKILNIKIKTSENVFKILYNINITYQQKQKFIEIINKRNKIDNKKNPRLKREFSYNIKQNNHIKNKININSTTDNNYNLIENNLYEYNPNQYVYNNKKKNNRNLKNFENNLSLKYNPNLTHEKINESQLPESITYINILKQEKQKEKEPLDNQTKRNKKQDEIQTILLKKESTKKKTIPIIKINYNKLNFDNENSGQYNLKEEYNPKETIKGKKVFNNDIILNNNYNNNFTPSINIKKKNDLIKDNINSNTQIKTINLNKNLNFEPQDNKKKNTIKNISHIINDDYFNKNNQPNTIIINNNMQINNYINNNAIYNTNNVVSDFFYLSNFEEKYKINTPIINITLNNK